MNENLMILAQQSAPITPEMPIGFFVGYGIVMLAGIVSLVCLIMVLVKLFPKEGPGLGVLGIFCGIYTYIWGWMKHKETGLKKVMLIWTAMIVVAFIGYGVMGISMASAVKNNPEAWQTAPGYTAPPAP